jgi:ABC-type branched-subunit amino acid transport system substrate-binding protein
LAIFKRSARKYAAICALGAVLLPAGAQQIHAQSAPGVTGNSITIGAWIALSGPMAIYGVPVKEGVQSYFRAVNEKGGIKGRTINWITEDNAYNPQQTVTIARKLISRDNVLAIFAPHGTAQTQATFPYVLDQEKVPIILPSFGTALDWFTPVRPNLLGAQAIYEDQARLLGRWAAQDRHKNILVMYGAAAAFQNVANFVEPGAKSVAPDAHVELMAVKIGTADYVPIALEVMAKKPDAIVLIQIQQEIVALARALQQQGTKISLYTYTPNTTQSILALGAEYVEGLKALSLIVSPLADTPAVKEYRAALAKYYPDEKPEFTSLMSYGLAKIFVEALRQASEPLTRDSLMKGFYKLKDYESGIYPPVTFAPDRPLGASQALRMQIVNGRWEQIGDWIELGKN